jgi:tRNA (guanine-N7-)-methyltransferase
MRAARRRLNRFKYQEPDAQILRKYYQRIPMDHVASGVHGLPFLSGHTLFGDGRPLVLDLGCGRGEHCIQKALAHPELGLVGIDFHEKSLKDACSKAAEQGVDNVRFLCVDLRWGLHLFEWQSVCGVYLLFPPPISVGRQKFSNREVLSADLMAQLGKLMMPHARLTLATDVPRAFERWKRFIAAQPHFVPDETERLETTTWYQRVWGRHGLPLLMLSVRRRDAEVPTRHYRRPFLVFAPAEAPLACHRVLVECLAAECQLPVSQKVEEAVAADTILIPATDLDLHLREALRPVRRKFVLVSEPPSLRLGATNVDTLSWADGILAASAATRGYLMEVYGPQIAAKVLVVGSPLPAVEELALSDCDPKPFMRRLRHLMADFTQRLAREPLETVEGFDGGAEALLGIGMQHAGNAVAERRS